MTNETSTTDKLCLEIKAWIPDSDIERIAPICFNCLLERVCPNSPYPPKWCKSFIPEEWKNYVQFDGKWWGKLVK